MVFFLTSHTTCQDFCCACQLTCISFTCKNLRVKYQKLAKTLSNIYIEGEATRLQTSLPNERGTKLLEGRNMSRPIVSFFLIPKPRVSNVWGLPLSHGMAKPAGGKLS